MIPKRCTNAIRKADKPLAIVLGSYLTSGLGVVRNIGRMGIPSLVVASKKDQLSFYSKYTQGVICPDPKKNEKEYINFLLEIGEKLNEKGVLLPISDTDTIAILKNEEILKKYFIFTSAKLDIVNRIVNKKNFYKLLEEKDLPHPKTYFSEDIKEIPKKINFPCIIKPVYSSYFVSDFNTKLFTAKSKNELKYFYEKAKSKDHEVVIQEIIPKKINDQYGLNAYYNHKHESMGVFMYRRIREWPHSFGNGCFIENIWIKELKELISPLIQSMKYFGVIDAEFVKDPRDNLFKIIEINPRIWMQNSLPSRCGINIPYIAYLDAIGKEIEKKQQTKKVIKWLYFPDDFKSSIKSIRKANLTFNKWIVSYKGKKEYAVFDYSDPIPFFVLAIKSAFLPFIYFSKK